MLLLDTILLSPIYATLWAARQVQAAVAQAQVQEAGQITASLSELYMMLETGRLTESEFDAQEKLLLDRMEAMQNSPTQREPPAVSDAKS